MAHIGKPYSLYSRKRKKSKPLYYARFKRPDGTWSPGKSTGATNRNAAEAWAFNYLQGGAVVLNEHVTFEAFAKGFFDWDNEWATDKRVTGKRISRRQCKENEAILRKKIIPALGKYRLVGIDKGLIKAFRNDLFNKGYAGSTINKTLYCLKTILATAEEQSLVRFVPKIESAANRPKMRGILSVDEVRQLFNLQWPDFRTFVINLAAASTGLRRGELLGLTLSQIKDNHIVVCRSWDEATGTMNLTTKTGRNRTVILPSRLLLELQRLIQINPWSKPESFLFFSTIESKPMEGKMAIKDLGVMLTKIGIDEHQRQERNITFHSWRHWYNSLLINARVPLQKVQSLTGHLTNEMSQHYYHTDRMDDVVQVVQEALFN